MVMSIQGQVEEILKVEKIGSNLFKASSPKSLMNLRVYGGQLVAQALRAASETVAEGRFIHSLHCYFLRPGDIEKCINYKVETLRDGSAFSTRRIDALQDNKLIFYMIASFQTPEKGLGLCHQFKMPHAPSPSTLESHQELFLRYSKDPRLSPKLRKKLDIASQMPLPMDIRYVDAIDPFNPHSAPPSQLLWVKPTGKLTDDPLMHQCVAAYASDWALINTMLRPFGLTHDAKELDVASLDHSIWFHQEFRADQWMLYELLSPRTVMSRGIAFGRMFDQEGRLVASFAQEGLVRVRPEMHKSKL